jgi:very-short-patch-repair endonuclease
MVAAAMARGGAFVHQSPPEGDGDAVRHRIGAELHDPLPGGADDAEMHRRDRAILALAARQHGIATTAQLLDAGVGRRSIARRVARGWLVPLHRGVFQVGPVEAPCGREMAAVLAIGEGAALSHQSAAAVWGFTPPHRGVVHVTVARRGRRSRRGIRVHQTRSLNAAVKDRLPLTDPARTLKDLRTVLPRHELDRALEQAQILDLIRYDGAPEPEFTRSEGERRLKALCKAAGLPIPRMNAPVAGWEVDAYWPAHNLVVEVDGWNFHRTRQAFERDRRKDADLATASYRVVRITWRRLRYEPYTVAAQLAVLLTSPTAVRSRAGA